MLLCAVTGFSYCSGYRSGIVRGIVHFLAGFRILESPWGVASGDAYFPQNNLHQLTLSQRFTGEEGNCYDFLLLHFPANKIFRIVALHA